MPILCFGFYVYLSFGRYIGDKKIDEDKHISEKSISLSTKVGRVIVWLVLVSMNILILWNTPTAVNVSFLFLAFGVLLYDLAMFRYKDKLILAYGITAHVCFSLVLAFFWSMATLAVHDASKVVIKDNMLYEHIQGQTITRGNLLRSYDKSVVLYDKVANQIIFIRLDNGVVSKLEVNSTSVNFLRQRVKLER